MSGCEWERFWKEYCWGKKTSNFTLTGKILFEKNTRLTYYWQHNCSFKQTSESQVPRTNFHFLVMISCTFMFVCVWSCFFFFFSQPNIKGARDIKQPIHDTACHYHLPINSWNNKLHFSSVASNMTTSSPNALFMQPRCRFMQHNKIC